MGMSAKKKRNAKQIFANNLHPDAPCIYMVRIGNDKYLTRSYKKARTFIETGIKAGEVEYGRLPLSVIDLIKALREDFRSLNTRAINKKMRGEWIACILKKGKGKK